MQVCLSVSLLQAGGNKVGLYLGIPSREHLQNGYGCRIPPSQGGRVQGVTASCLCCWEAQA